jgi:hypothetical protein
MVSPTRHSCESRNPGPKVSAEALDPRFAGRRKKNVPAHLPRRRPHGLAEAGITHQDVDHLIIYDAPCLLPGASFAHLPIYGLEDLSLGRPPGGRSRPMAAVFPRCEPP